MAIIIGLLALFGVLGGAVWWIEDRAVAGAEAQRWADAAKVNARTADDQKSVNLNLQASLSASDTKVRTAEAVNRELLTQLDEVEATEDQCPPGSIISIPVAE